MNENTLLCNSSFSYFQYLIVVNLTQYFTIFALQVPSTPRHNVVKEKMNRTILEMMRCMMKVTQIPTQFWGEDILTVSYLINRSPSIYLDFDSLERI